MAACFRVGGEHMMRRFTAIVCSVAVVGIATWAAGQRRDPKVPSRPVSLFEPSDRCMACHNNLVTPAGEDVSIGQSWRGSMMANSSRDPYWQASVRRETIDHPRAKEAIEDECSKCHMPMMRFEAKTAGQKGTVFTHLPFMHDAERASQLAADGVSCTVCHQITDEGLGRPESYVGNFSIDTTRPQGDRPVFGPFEIDQGRTTIMRSATGYKQTETKHIQKSELCATCHTLLTRALGPNGEEIGELPEQVPYQEWLHSSYREEKSCQDCHMPKVTGDMPIAAVLGEPREGLSRHNFRGGNFFITQMLHKNRGELGVRALPQELELATRVARDYLQTETAEVAVDRVGLQNGNLETVVSVKNLSGHKFPTAYPSRRAWLHVTVKDANGNAVFESGKLMPNGSIRGNDNDADAKKYEPHYSEVRNAEEVQIYESIIVDRAGSVTTGLLSALRYVKDNRLLPRGFNKANAEEQIAVHGAASTDDDFTGGSDRVRYVADVSRAQGPFTVDVALMFQPVGYRWAENLRTYEAAEVKRFNSYYDSMAAASAVVVSSASVRTGN